MVSPFGYPPFMPGKATAHLPRETPRVDDGATAISNPLFTLMTIIDDLSAIEARERPIQFIENDRPNSKLSSTPQNIAYFEFLLELAKHTRFCFRQTPIQAITS